jgi:hypothetical protein
MAKAKKSEAVFPRLTWGRSPVQRAHSTPKGERGYNRRKAKNEARQRVREGV